MKALRLFLFLLAASCLLAPTTLQADGTQTGRLVGIVIDADDTPVQGVNVFLDGPQGRRDAVSDAEGRFRFPSLPVASYRAGAELFGLAAPIVEARVSVDRTSEVRLVLGAAEANAEDAVLDAIQVIAEAPLVDRFETRVGASVSYDFLDALPVERFYQSVALLLPGVSSGPGGEDGNPNASGALRSANLYLIDGVDTTDPTTGLFGLNLAYESIDEVEVGNAALSAEYGRVSGAVVNVVTRSGGNLYGGRVRWSATDGAWNDDFEQDPERTPHLRPEIDAAAATEDLDATISFSLRGPIVPDKVFFAAAWESLERSFQRPSAIGVNWDEDFRNQSGAFKVDALPSSTQSLVVQHTFDDAEVRDFAPFELNPAENRLPQLPTGSLDDPLFRRRPGEPLALDARTQDGSFTKLGWNATFGSSLAVRASFAEQERELRRGADSRRGLTADAPHAVVLPDSVADDEIEQLFLANGVGLEGFERRPRRQANLAADWFHALGGVDAELTIGIDHQRTESESLLQIPGFDGLDPETGEPVSGQIYFDFDTRLECLINGICLPFDFAGETFQPFGLLNSYSRPLRKTEERSTALHLSETLSGKRWMLRLGVRYEQLEATADGGGGFFDDDDFAPRVAMTWDALGDGKTLLTGAWSRYHEPILQQVIDAQRIADPLSGYSFYLWDFENPVCLGLDPEAPPPVDPTSPCWLFDESVMPYPLQIAGANPNLRRSSVDEIVFGFRRAVGETGALSLHWIDRTWEDLWDDVLTFDATGEVVAELLNLPIAERTYRAVQLLYQWRDRNRWQMVASYTWSEAEGNLFAADGLSTFADFVSLTDVNVVNRFGPAPYDRPHQFSLFASRAFAFQRSDLTLASALKYRDGLPFHLEAFADAGIRFLTPRGSERLDGALQWDVSARYLLRLREAFALEMRGEVFNLTNENEQLGAENLVDSGTPGLPRGLGDLQNPRSYRFTFGLRF